MEASIPLPGGGDASNDKRQAKPSSNAAQKRRHSELGRIDDMLKDAEKGIGPSQGEPRAKRARVPTSFYSGSLCSSVRCSLCYAAPVFISNLI